MQATAGRRSLGREQRDARRALRGRVTIISPHSDDGVLSLGAAIAAATSAGAEIRIVTVLGNDATSTAPAADWDRACGFATVGEAARARREEDRRACALVGAEPVWLPFADMEYDAVASADDVWAAVVEAAAGSDALLIPGFPLDQPDHAWLTRLVLEKRPETPLGLYVEQPYAALRLIGRGGRTWARHLTPRASLQNLVRMVASPDPTLRPTTLEATAELAQPRDWFPLATNGRDRAAKARAVRAYSSQVAAFGPLVLPRIALYERLWGGEGLAWAHDAQLPLQRLAAPSSERMSATRGVSD